MGKKLGSWSAMRKYLEQEMLADSLKGRVQYICTTYPNMEFAGVFDVRVDKEVKKQFSIDVAAFQKYHGHIGVDRREIWAEFWQNKDIPVEQREYYDDMEFGEALKIYRSLPIGESLAHTNPIVRMFAVLDRRVGKRTLEKIKPTVSDQIEWLQYFYRLRLGSENML